MDFHLHMPVHAHATSAPASCRPGFGPSWRVVGLAFSGLIGASVEIGGRSEVATG